MPLSASDLLLLGQYDTPTISNVIELFEVRARREGFMDGRIRACFAEMGPIVGYASTATMRTAHPRAEADVYNGLDEQVARFAELPGPAIVVFQDLDEPPVGATFGEVMCASYQCFGALGVITNGPARDLEQVRRLGFRAFSDGVVSSHADSHITSLHQPVQVGGMLVRPGTCCTPTPTESAAFRRPSRRRWRTPRRNSWRPKRSVSIAPAVGITTWLRMRPPGARWRTASPRWANGCGPSGVGQVPDHTCPRRFRKT